ncbi:hypothetical protein PG984_007278 [Apiospora sp. TS-2023a]
MKDLAGRLLLGRRVTVGHVVDPQHNKRGAAPAPGPRQAKVATPPTVAAAQVPEGKQVIKPQQSQALPTLKSRTDKFGLLQVWPIGRWYSGPQPPIMNYVIDMKASDQDMEKNGLNMLFGVRNDKLAFWNRQVPAPVESNRSISGTVFALMVKEQDKRLEAVIVPVANVEAMKPKGYTLWDFPDLILHEANGYQDPRECQRANAVITHDKPHMDTAKLFEEGEQPGNDNIAIVQQFVMRGDPKDSRLLTSTGHVFKEKMPADIGLDWGGYMQFYAWQSVGRHLNKEMAPVCYHQTEYDQPVTAIFDDGDCWNIPAPSDWVLRKAFGPERKPACKPKSLRDSMQSREDRAAESVGNLFYDYFSPHF